MRKTDDADVSATGNFSKLTSFPTAMSDHAGSIVNSMDGVTT